MLRIQNRRIRMFFMILYLSNMPMPIKWNEQKMMAVLKDNDVNSRQCGGSWFLPILNPKTATKERDEKEFFVIPFYMATNFTKLNIILVLKSWRKKFGLMFQELSNFTQKFVTPLLYMGLGSGIRKKHIRIPDPGVKNVPDPDSQPVLRIRDPGWEKVSIRIRDPGWTTRIIF